MITFILFIFVCLLCGGCMMLYDRLTKFENVLSILQYQVQSELLDQKDGDIIGRVEGNR